MGNCVTMLEKNPTRKEWSSPTALAAAAAGKPVENPYDRSLRSDSVVKLDGKALPSMAPCIPMKVINDIKEIYEFEGDFESESVLAQRKGAD